MYWYMFVGKGGTGKTTLAVALALYFIGLKAKVAIIDFDGGHSVLRTLGIVRKFEPNVVHELPNHLGFAVIENTPFLGVADAKQKGWGIEQYLAQFPEDLGLLPFADMVNEFFGVPTDTYTLQKFLNLVSVVHELKERGYNHIVLDVEPTAGLERLLKGTVATFRSLENLQKSGPVLLTMIGAKWPDIRTYLTGHYIRNAGIYIERMKEVVRACFFSQYVLTALPESSPVEQTFDVRQIVEGMKGKVRLCVVNNVRGEPHEEAAMVRLRDHDVPVVIVERQHSLHNPGLASSTHRQRKTVLCKIGEQIFAGLTRK